MLISLILSTCYLPFAVEKSGKIQQEGTHQSFRDLAQGLDDPL